MRPSPSLLSLLQATGELIDHCIHLPAVIVVPAK